MLQKNDLKNLGISELSHSDMQSINGGGFLQWVGEIVGAGIHYTVIGLAALSQGVSSTVGKGYPPR
jgi:hypothetical protein